jgi:hypothetical protein
MNNSEKLATLGTRDTGHGKKKKKEKEKRNNYHRQLKRWAIAKCWTSLYANIHKNTIRHESSCIQLEVKTNRTSFVCGNCNGHHNTELRTNRHIIGQHKKLKI